MAAKSNAKRALTSGVCLLLVAAMSAHAGDKWGKNDHRDWRDKDRPKKETVVSVPEPATLALFGAGATALGLSIYLRRRKR